MLTKRIREEIEWHFYKFKADISLYDSKVSDILESGLVVNLESAGRSNIPGDPTECKALKLIAIDEQKTWATVVRNTFNAFRFKPEYDIMIDLYIKGRKRKELFAEGLWERTFWRWRDAWLETAYKWAKEFKLL